MQIPPQTKSSLLIRWRGKQDGPYTEANIDMMLASNRIGLLHEVFHGGHWVTLRDYYAQRDAVLRAELQAREEQERQAREIAEQQSKEREEQLLTATIAEERRKNDLMAAALEREDDFGRNSSREHIQLQ